MIFFFFLFITLLSYAMTWISFCHRQTYHFFSILNSSLISTSRISAILTNVSIGGWLELVHHLLTVVGAHSNCSDSHLFVLFLSARTTLILFSILLQMSCTLLYNNTRTKLIKFPQTKKRKPFFCKIQSILYLFLHFYSSQIPFFSVLDHKKCHHWQKFNVE